MRIYYHDYLGDSGSPLTRIDFCCPYAASQLLSGNMKIEWSHEDYQQLIDTMGGPVLFKGGSIMKYCSNCGAETQIKLNNQFVYSGGRQHDPNESPQ